MKLGEFIVALGVQADLTGVNAFTKTLGDLPMQSVAAIAALADIETHLTEVAKQAMNAAVGFQMFEAQTGLSVQQLQSWQRVAVQANVSAEAISSGVSSLQRNLAAIRMGGGNVGPYQLLGISPTGNAFDVIRQLRGRIAGMDRSTATTIIGQMGLGPEWMRVLTLSEAKWKEYTATANTLTKSQIDQLLEYKETFNKLSFAVHTFLVTGLLAFAGALKDVLMPVVNFLRTIAPLKDWAIGIGIAFLPATAAVVGFVLVLQDLMYWSQGKKSLFGEAAKSLKSIFEDPLFLANKLLDVMTKIEQKTAKFTGGSLASPIPFMARPSNMVGAGIKTLQIYLNGNLSEPIIPGLVKAIIEEAKKEFSIADASVNNGGR